MDQLTGGEGGEEKDEGRVGFEAIIAPNTTGSLAAEGENLDRARKGGGIFTVYCEAVIREAAGRVGVPKQRLCASSVAPVYR